MIVISKNNKYINLDNSANIYTGAKNRKWTNIFRLSITLKDDIDETILQLSLDKIITRFPSIAARITNDLHWYYIDKVKEAPKIQLDYDYPLKFMSFSDIQNCAFRVLYANNRLSVEFFHAVTDGYGATVFIKTLLAEYLTQKYKISITEINGVLNRLEPPRSEELEDSYFVYATESGKRTKEKKSFHIKGTKEKKGRIHNTAIILSVQDALKISKVYSVSLTELLGGIMITALLNIQNQKRKKMSQAKSVKVLIPINLRKIFKSQTLRNFTFYAIPGIDPKKEKNILEKNIYLVHQQMRLNRLPEHIIPQISANVLAEKKDIIRIMPLCIKNLILRTVFHFWGEKNSSLTLSNLGQIVLPKEMNEYVTRFDFLLGVRSNTPYNCGVISYDDMLCINLTRNIKEAILENSIIELLKEQSIDFKVENGLNYDAT